MADPDPQIPVLEALIAFAQVQLTEAWAEVRDQNTYALALAALGIAVIGIIAAVQSQLGGDWWVPILACSSRASWPWSARAASKPALALTPNASTKTTVRWQRRTRWRSCFQI